MSATSTWTSNAQTQARVFYGCGCPTCSIHWFFRRLLVQRQRPCVDFVVEWSKPGRTVMLFERETGRWRETAHLRGNNWPY
jgi:hypothetical protein